MTTMSSQPAGQIEVRMVRLSPMRVASALGFGPSPEGEAWAKLRQWAGDQHLPDNIEPGRFFGFNNPSPSAGSPNYGYEQWMVLAPDAHVVAGDDVAIKTFDGGMYAVTRCTLGNIGQVWKRLAAWRETSPYRFGNHQWLEEAIADSNANIEEMVFDLYLPIAG